MGRLAASWPGAVGEEQAPPGDPDPDGQERQRQAATVEEPVGHAPPRDGRRTWRAVSVTTVSRAMMPSTCDGDARPGASPPGVGWPGPTRDTIHTRRRRWRKTAPMAMAPMSTPTVTPTRSRPAPSAPATATPDGGDEGQGHRRRHEHRRRASIPPGRRRHPDAGTGGRRTPSETSGPAGIELAMAVAATVTAVSAAGRHVDATGLEQPPLDEGERHERAELRPPTPVTIHRQRRWAR